LLFSTKANDVKIHWSFDTLNTYTKKIIVKTFLAKKPDGSKELITVKYDRANLMAPIYVLRNK